MKFPRLTRGYSILEVLTVVSIIGLLAALLMPAISAARESSHCMKCKSNLKQIGIALHSHLSAQGKYPYDGYELVDSSPQSCLTQLLPYMEKDNLYGAFGNYNPHLKVVTEYSFRVNIYLCPSDPAAGAIINRHSVVSYAGNAGSGRAWRGYDGLIGPYTSTRISHKMITDGLSTTAAFSEYLASNGTDFPSRRVLWQVDPAVLPPAGEEQYIAACQSSTTPAPALANQMRGQLWQFSRAGTTWYTHQLNPNQFTCTNGELADGALTAGSMHPGQVNVLFADGHVGSISDSISTNVWRAFGTRAASDITSY